MYIRQLDILFHQITMFIKVHVPFVFGLQLKDLVNSSNQRVWSSKTKATRTYMNVGIWQKSVSNGNILSPIYCCCFRLSLLWLGEKSHCWATLYFIFLVTGKCYDMQYARIIWLLSFYFSGKEQVQGYNIY